MPSYTFNQVQGFKKNGKLALVVPQALLEILFPDGFLKLKNGTQGPEVTEFYANEDKDVYMDGETSEAIARAIEAQGAAVNFDAEIAMRQVVDEATNTATGRTFLTLSCNVLKVTNLKVADAVEEGFVVRKREFFADGSRGGSGEPAPAGVTAAGAASSLLAGRFRR